jgi:hypothetical protein
MLKKLLTVAAASAFALTLAAPVASACPGMEEGKDKTAESKKAEDSKKVVKNESKRDTKADTKTDAKTDTKSDTK